MTALQPIRALRARISRDAAIEALAGGVAGGVRRLALGPLRSIADVYVPFTLFRVIVRRGRGQESAVFGIDAVAGALDLYRFDGVPRSDEIVEVPTRNHVDAALPTSVACEILTARVMRTMYQRVGFIAGGRARVDVQAVGERVYVPYWIGFFGRADDASLVVMDAVRRQIEGAKMRRLIAEWISLTTRRGASA